LVQKDRRTCAVEDANVLEDLDRSILAVKILGTDRVCCGALCDCNRGNKGELKRYNKGVSHNLVYLKGKEV